jgi:hypothetical protein
VPAADFLEGGIEQLWRSVAEQDTSLEVQERWAAYTGKEVYSLPEIAGAYTQPTRRIHSLVSIDIDELIRNTSVAFGKIMNLNTVRGQYSRDTPVDEYTCEDEAETARRRAAVSLAIHAVIQNGLAEPDDDIGLLVTSLQEWRKNGVYVVANSSGLEGCDADTVKFLQEFLPDCFDAVLFPRNHDGLGGLTKVGAVQELAQATGMELSDMPVAFLDDMEHQLIHAIDTLGTDRLRLFALAKHGYNSVPEGAVSAEKSRDVFALADKFFGRSRLYLPWGILRHAIEGGDARAHSRPHDADAIYQRAAFAYLNRHIDQVWEEAIEHLPDLKGEWHPNGHAVFKLRQLEGFEVDPLLGEPRLHTWTEEPRGDINQAFVQGVLDGAWHDHYWYIVAQSLLPHVGLQRERQLQYAYTDTLYDVHVEGLHLSDETLQEQGLVRECVVTYQPDGTVLLAPTGRCVRLEETERRVITDKHVLKPFETHATTVEGVAATFLTAGNRVQAAPDTKPAQGPVVFKQGIGLQGQEVNFRRELTTREKEMIREQLKAAA